LISAFTLVKVVPHRNVQVFKKIKKLQTIEEATLVYGKYDIILKTHTKSIEELNRFIYSIVRKTPSITTTTTMIVAHIPKKR
jgi:DNA-binding Lrp family transcriptional regulator